MCIKSYFEKIKNKEAFRVWYKTMFKTLFSIISADDDDRLIINAWIGCEEFYEMKELNRKKIEIPDTCSFKDHECQFFDYDYESNEYCYLYAREIDSWYTKENNFIKPKFCKAKQVKIITQES